MSMRCLSPVEIARLEARGCTIADPSRLFTADPFDPAAFRNVTFLGEVHLESGCSISDSTLSGCHVGSGAQIRRTALIQHTGSSPNPFGTGRPLSILDETGGRPVWIHPRLTPAEAYLQTFFRHSPLLSRAFRHTGELIGKHASDRTLLRIGPGVKIFNCGTISDTDILGGTLEGVISLRNSTITGDACIGPGVIADGVVVCGGRLSDAARAEGCYIGPGATVTNGFSAHNSLIFTGSNLQNGESAAIFAGPFTTSMHKSTLLIGGYFNFFNAGSGSNQSNHRYKLGAVHQGTLARGCKTGSDSYILWPAAFGAFTTIIGRHYGDPDTRRFPFSLLVENKAGGSRLIPGAALRSVGLARDVEKWPKRMPSDCGAPLPAINFQWLSPFTLQQVIDGAAALREFLATDSPSLHIQGATISIRDARRGLDIYNKVMRLYAGAMLRKRILTLSATTPEADSKALVERLLTDPGADGCGRWLDMAGLVAPRREVDAACSRFIAEAETATDADSATASLARLNESLDTLGARYNSLAWSWTWHNLSTLCGTEASALDAGSICQILTEAAEETNRLAEGFRDDATGEYDFSSAGISFGADADTPEEARADFERVRGSVATNPFLAAITRRLKLFTDSIAAIRLLLSPSEADQEFV